jgi:hypothetical protein
MPLGYSNVEIRIQKGNALMGRRDRRNSFFLTEIWNAAPPGKSARIALQ